MYIRNIKLINYRNYEKLEVYFDKNLNIIYGDNAQGKTNILEAIFLCAAGRSHRTAKDNELVRQGEAGYHIILAVEREYSDKTIDVRFEKDEKKKIKINGIPIKKIAELIGHFNAVIFSPEDLNIISEGPSERRRFIDITISQLKPTYLYDLQQYVKILSQRNSLLKELQYKKKLVDTLTIWNDNLAEVGARLMSVRKEFLYGLNTAAEDKHYKLTDGREKLMLKYTPSVGCDGFDHVNEIKKTFIKTLEAAVNKEIYKGTTLYGPHRDDYEIFLNGMSLKAYGSQGQKRTAVLSIKLSEIDMMKEATGEMPVLLLDDVMSELDRKRQEFLFDNVGNIQTFITCTRKYFSLEKTQDDAFFLNVNNGEVNIG